MRLPQIPRPASRPSSCRITPLPLPTPNPPTRKEKNYETVSPPSHPALVHQNPDPRYPNPTSIVVTRNPTRDPTPPDEPNTSPPSTTPTTKATTRRKHTTSPTQTPRHQKPLTTKAWARKRSRSYRCPLPPKASTQQTNPQEETVYDRRSGSPQPILDVTLEEPFESDYRERITCV